MSVFARFMALSALPYRLSQCTRSLHTANRHFDWIRKNTTRRPETYKIDRTYTLTEDEKIPIVVPKAKPLSIQDHEVVEVACSQVKHEVSDNHRFAAIVQVGGHQYKVTVGDMIATRAYNQDVEVGDFIYLEKVLTALSKNSTLIGRPLLSPDLVRVSARVIEKTLTFPLMSFQFHRRRRHRKMRVVQEPLTVLRICGIDVNPQESLSEE